MWYRTLFNSLRPGSARALVRQARRHNPHRRGASARLRVELLEDRVVPSFSPAVSYPAANGSPVVTADFNGDGRLDLAVANINSVSVLLGNSDGTFQPAIASPSTGTGGAMAGADFNGDGQADLVTTWDGMAMILLGNGDGTLQAPSPLLDFGTGSFGFLAVAAADLDGNGTTDLVFTGHAGDEFGVQGSFFVLLGNGDGSFVGNWSNSLGVTPDSIALADLDGNGTTDLVIGDSSPIGVCVILGNGDGTFYFQSWYEVGSSPRDVGVADFTNDGNPDLAFSVYLGGVPTYEILSGNGAGAFQYAGNFRSGGVGKFAIADFNGDSKPDLVTSSDGGVDVVLGNGGNFAAPLHVAVPYPSLGRPVAADFNGDGFPDVAGNAGNDAVSVLLNDGMWEGTPPPPPPTPSLTISDASIAEGNISTASVVFTVSLSAASTEAVTVHYATSDASAVAGSDYQSASGTLTIPVGQRSATISVSVIGDRRGEANESFFLNLSSPTNATIADGQGVGTILDDEPRITISDVTKWEGRKNTTLFTFTVTLSAAYDQAVTMAYRTGDGTATTSDNDYIAKTGTITFNPGETTKTITIVVNGDSKKEADETFYVDLFGNSSNSLITKSRGIGTILNDD